MENGHQPNFEVSPPSNRKTAVAIAVFLFLLMGNFYLYSRVNRAEVEAHTLETTLKEELARLEKKSSHHLNNAQQQIQELQASLEEAREEAAKKARAEAHRYTDRLSKNISSRERSEQEAVMGEIRNLNSKNSETEARVTEVHGELTGIKSDVEQAKSQLATTGSAIESTNDHMQEISEWVSFNSSEIGELRDRTNRNYFRFTLPKSEKMHKVGTVQLRLKKTEPKRNRYSVEILADDKKMVKKGQHVNEPVQFYVAGSDRPYEIVMTTIKKDQVIGFLATPKIETVRP